MELTLDPTFPERAATFRSLHHGDSPLVLPNPWDVGSARLLEGAGFSALATTSAGLAARVGVADGQATLEQIIGNVAELAAATVLPLSVDLENGYGDDPETAAQSVIAAANAGAVGGSIEDLPTPQRGLYDRGLAIERIVACVEAARAIDDNFMLTARCESFLTPNPDMVETVARLQAFQEAGADVVYAPGLRTAEQIQTVVSSVDVPVNVVMGLGGPTFRVEELGELGVARISLGSSFARAAYGALIRAMEEVQMLGTFGFADDAVPYGELCERLDHSNSLNRS